MYYFLTLGFFTCLAIWVFDKLSSKPQQAIKKRLPKYKYKEYINSQEWREKAKKIRKRDGNVCRLCNSKDKELHVHHSTYDRLGCEDDNDLITLCAPCHKKFHNKQ